MFRRGFTTALVVGLFALCTPSRALAQSAITGLVKDATGAVLPGVTVEASSDALIERMRSAVSDPQVRRALDWLVAHQDATVGNWFTASLNKQRDPATDAGKFMTDAATAYATLALTHTKP